MGPGHALVDNCGGVWTGSPRALADILKDRGIKTSESTVRRDLEGTKYIASGNPHQAARLDGNRKSKAASRPEQEAVHPDLGPASFKDLDDPNYYYMPDDVPRDKVGLE